MARRLQALQRIDPGSVPLPHGTMVTARVELHEGERRIPQGAVGQVVNVAGDRVDVKLADGHVIRYLRQDLVPTKLGQQRYAVRREQAWQALHPGIVVETVVGSRAWGLADEGSDTDRRGIFVLPFPWTTSLVDPPLDLVSADGSDTYWEVGKAIRQALRADPNTLETLFLPGAEARDPMGEQLLAVRDAFPSTAIYGSFGRYALSQLKRLGQSLRLAEHRSALVTWLRSRPSPTLDEAAAYLAEAAGIEATSPKDRDKRAKAYVKQLYASLHDRGLLPSKDFAAFVDFARRADLDAELPRQLRPKNAYNLIRLIAAATDWLATGEPHLRVEGALRDELLAIKRGEVPLDDILAQAERMMPALDRAREETTLPEHPDVGRIDATLRAIREEAAGRFIRRDPGHFGAEAPVLPAPEIVP